MSRKRKVPFRSSGSSFIQASTSLSSIVASAMSTSGTNPFCVSDTNSWTTPSIRLESTLVKIL
eukprot:3186240-Prymnesium_polylepis.1